QAGRPAPRRLALQRLVAAHARARGHSRLVLGDEVLHDVAVELLRHVPHVEGDAAHVGGPAGVVGVLDRAAAPRTRAVGLRIFGKGQVDTGDVVTRLGHTGRGDRGIDPAGHGGQYTQSHSAFSVCAPPGSKPRPGARPTGR